MVSLAAPIEADALRLRHEFISMPGLRLAAPQAARLLGVRADCARELLAALEHEGFLRHTPDGLYRLAQPLTS